MPRGETARVLGPEAQFPAPILLPPTVGLAPRSTTAPRMTTRLAALALAVAVAALTPTPAAASADMPPATPKGLYASAGNGSASLNWSPNAEADLAGYNVYRDGSRLNAGPVAIARFTDRGLANGTSYAYAVSAVNTYGLESPPSAAVAVTPGVPPSVALDLNSDATKSTYVTFGDPAKLHLATFTVETWFRRDGTGIAAATSSLNGVNLVPLVTKGASEEDGSPVDINFVLGLDAGKGTIAADFEDMASGTNHPVSGRTAVAIGAWHHAAATYDGSTWRLYLDGALETTLYVGQSPRSDSIQRAGLGTMLTSTGVRKGFFDGALDEARIWNRALGQVEIQGNVNAALTSAPGLVARWGLDQASGSIVPDSVATAANGTIGGTNYAWRTPGAPFDLVFNQPPATPVVVAPAAGATGVERPPQLSVQVSDPDGDALTVTFYGRATSTPPAPPFTLVALPDTQFYTSSQWGGTPEIFAGQTRWIADNRTARNVAFVTQLGDVTDAATAEQWQNASAALSLLEAPGVPYGLAVGNHDGLDGTANYNLYFGYERFRDRPYYGGRSSTSNFNNHYELFSAGGMDFLVVHLEYLAGAAARSWANGVLAAYPGRRAIVVNHDLFDPDNPSELSPNGRAIYDALKGNANLFLMLGGHVAAEARRSETWNGRTVHALLSDYQARDAGGNGWLRLLEFQPASNQIQVRTYSPYLDQLETDADSQFTLPYDMTGASSFQALGAVTVTSGSTATVAWEGLGVQAPVEWYAVASDGRLSATGPTAGFTTGGVVENRAPVAAAQALATTQDAAVAVVLAASDPDGDTLTYAVVTPPLHGVLTGTAPSLLYTPAAGYTGPDSFTFAANDGALDSNVATVTLTVNARTHTLTVSKTGAGSGTVASTPAGISCGTTCSASYVEGTAVTLAATPASGSVFAGWSGACTGSSCSVTMSAAQSVGAQFALENRAPVASPKALTTAQDTPVSLTLAASDPDGDALTFAIVTPPLHGVLTGTPPDVTYTPAPGYTGADSFTFKASDGALDSNVATVSVTVTATARSFTLSVARTGTGSGTISSTPAGISCGTACSASYAEGTAVSLAATPASGSVFAGWSGACTGTSCSLVMSSDRSATAQFARRPTAVNDSYSTTRGRTLAVAAPGVLANDTAPAGSTLTARRVSGPSRGTLTLNGDGSFSYVPPATYTGTVTFTYTASDAYATSTAATVTITVRRR